MDYSEDTAHPVHVTLLANLYEYMLGVLFLLTHHVTLYIGIVLDVVKQLVTQELKTHYALVLCIGGCAVCRNVIAACSTVVHNDWIKLVIT